MDEFTKYLDEIAVPDNYEKRFLDILDAVGDKTILTAEEKSALGLIVAYYWVEEYSRLTTTKNARAKTKPPPANKLPFDGNTLTKSQLGYRVPLANLPARLVRQLFAYVYAIAG